MVQPKRKKIPPKETLLKDSPVLNTLGPARPPSPSKEVASALSSLRPTPSPYRTPPDPPSTIEELLDHVPECSEVPPLEEAITVVQEKKKENPFGWNLPPTRSNWHDTPPKKGVPYAVLFGRNPIYVYVHDDQAVPSPYECPFHGCLYPTTSPNKVGPMSSVPHNRVRSSWTKRRHPPSWINCDNRNIPN